VVDAGPTWVVEERIPVAPGVAAAPHDLAVLARATVEVSGLALPERTAPGGESTMPRLRRRLATVTQGLARDMLAAKRIMADPALPEGTVHGDFHPGNVFVGDGAVWVIDWELSGRGPLGRDALHYWCSIEDGAGRAALWEALVAEVGAPHEPALRRLRYAVAVQTLAGASANAADFDRDPVLAQRLSRLLPQIRV
jgi:hypothetical protein